MCWLPPEANQRVAWIGSYFPDSVPFLTSLLEFLPSEAKFGNCVYKEGCRDVLSTQPSSRLVTEVHIFHPMDPYNFLWNSDLSREEEDEDFYTPAVDDRDREMSQIHFMQSFASSLEEEGETSSMRHSGSVHGR